MQRLLLGAALLLGLVAASLRHVPAGALAWAPGSGRLAVAGSPGTLVLRFQYRKPERPPLVVTVAAASREGARVTVTLELAPPPGRYAWAAAPTAGAGAAVVVEGAVREAVAALPLPCLADASPAGCRERGAAAVATVVAARLGLEAGAVAVELVPDAEAVAAAERAALAVATRPARRVVVVGLDGADWELLEPFARRGIMPNLARLMDQGTWGALESLTPLLSPLIWTTMATGVSPEEHGILDFLEVDPESGTRIPITGRKRQVPALWNMASAAGLSPVVAGWWATWPAEVIRGVMVSDRLFYLLADTVGSEAPGTLVFPPELEGEMRELAARAMRETDEAAVRALLPVSSAAYREAVAAGKGMADPIDGFRRILVGTRTYFGATLAALRPTTDLAMVYCIGTDEIGHLLAPYLPPLLPGRDAAFAEVARVGVERYFAVVDRWLGRLMDACPLAECAFLVVSDHGFKWGADRPRELSGVAAATAAVWHRPEGVFLAAGHGVEGRGRVQARASVFDVAPTVAALLELPADRRWRGTPLPGCPPARRPTVDWAAVVPPASYRPSATASASPAAETVAQLRALGYLEGGEGGPSTVTETEGSLNNLGLVHLEARRYREAEAAFQRAIAANPRYASPHYNLRRVYLETGQFEEADRALWRAVELGLRDAAGAVDRAATDWEARQLPDRALDLLRRGSEQFPREPRLVAHRLALLVRLGRCAQALEEGRAAAQRFPDAAPVHAFAGLAAACAGRPAEARAALERSLRLDPDQPLLRDALAALPPR